MKTFGYWINIHVSLNRIPKMLIISYLRWEDAQDPGPWPQRSPYHLRRGAQHQQAVRGDRVRVSDPRRHRPCYPRHQCAQVDTLKLRILIQDPGEIVIRNLISVTKRNRILFGCRCSLGKNVHLLWKLSVLSPVLLPCLHTHDRKGTALCAYSGQFLPLRPYCQYSTFTIVPRSQAQYLCLLLSLVYLALDLLQDLSQCS